ncbi:MAG: helix-turn-helix transcriptional regulator [Candidatus Coatesbacteria bacterium]
MAPRAKSSKPLTLTQASLNLGLRVRAARRRHGFTQERLGERLGLSSNFIAHLERGSRQPSLHTIVGLARVLGVSISSLFRA